MFNKFQNIIHVPGALAADLVAKWTAPSNCSLVHVSAVTSNDSAALLIIGLSDDTNEFLESTVIGDSGTPAEFNTADFVDGDPHILKGEIIVVTLDYDGSSGTAGEDFTLVMTFIEG